MSVPRWLVACTCGLALAGSLPQSAAAQETGGEKTQETVTEKTFADAVALIGEAKGNVVVFNIFSSADPTCRAQLGVLNEIVNRYPTAKKYPFKLVAVSVDEDADALAKFLKQKPILGQTVRLVAGGDDSKAVMKAAGMKEFKDAIPYTAVFNMDGTCVKEFNGYADKKSLSKPIDDIYLRANKGGDKAAGDDKADDIKPGKSTPINLSKVGGSRADGPTDILGGLTMRHLIIIGAGIGGGLLVAAGLYLRKRKSV